VVNDLRLRLGLFALVSVACAAEPATNDVAVRREVSGALERYMRASRAVQADSIAANFAPTGMLFEPGINPIVTPDSIRAFVRMFTGAVVESASVTPDTIEVHGPSAYLWGSYYERLSFPGQPRSEQRGRLVMHWVRDSTGQWLINRYLRVPVTTQESPGK
jgi:ketosteroid isomerase-like protein